MKTGHLAGMNKLNTIIKFEEMDSDYPETQANGIFMETEKFGKGGFYDPNYVSEKIDNILHFYDGTLSNFKNRMNQDPETRKTFLKFVKREKKELDKEEAKEEFVEKFK